MVDPQKPNFGGVQPNYKIVKSYETGKGASFWPFSPLCWQSGGSCHSLWQVFYEPNKKKFIPKYLMPLESKLTYICIITFYEVILRVKIAKM